MEVKATILHIQKEFDVRIELLSRGCWQVMPQQILPFLIVGLIIYIAIFWEK